MTTEPPRVAAQDDSAAMIAHHRAQGMLHAKAAMCNSPWYHGHQADTRRAAEHFAVADAIARMSTRACCEGVG